jgi:glycosyltransferase involved in cell wall biosynthesis
MTKPLLSIIIPVFNVEPYLRQCVESVRAQTLKEIEIICVDDGSTDESLNILKELAKQDERITVISKKNSGYGDSMNRGFEAAAGKYVGIVESDDWVDNNMFEVLYRAAEENQAEIVKSGFYITKTTPTLTEELYNVISPRLENTVFCPAENSEVFWYQPSIWSGIYLREFLIKNRIQFRATPGASYQDTGFHMKVLSAAQRMYYIPAAYLHYRSDNPNASVKSKDKAYFICEEMESSIAFADSLTGDFATDSRKKELRGILWAIAFGLYLWNLKRLDAGLKKEFFVRMRKDFTAAEKAGAVNLTYMPTTYRLFYHLMMRTPGLFYGIANIMPKNGIRRTLRGLFKTTQK